MAAESSAVLRFVSSPEPDRTVGLDLNAGRRADLPIRTLREGTDLGAPPLERFTTAPANADGDDITGSRYGNRTLTLNLRVYGSGWTFARAMSALGRQLNHERNWLEFKPPGVDDPVFFRTFRTDISRLDLSNAGEGNDKWNIELDVLAEPFAYGATVSDQVQTSTDPAAGASSDPLVVVLPDIKGDVPAPLTVKVGPVNTGPEGPMMVSVCSGAPAFTVPFYAQAEALTQGFDTSVLADASMSGGSYSRTTFATNTLGVYRLQGDIAAVPAGRWRVWARLRTSVIGSEFDLRLDNGTVDASVAGQVRRFDPISDVAYWFDLGTIDHPFWAPPDSTDAATLSLRLFAQRMVSTGNLDIDVVLLVPLDLRGNTPGRVALATPTAYLVTGNRWIFDPAHDMVHASVPALPAAAVGSYDFRAVPGENTYIHMLRRVYPGFTQLAGTNSVEWSYRPRWLYVSEP